MTHDRDLERVLDSWLADGPLVVADRVIDDLADRIGHQRQRPAWRLRPRRFNPMTSTLKLAASAAVLVVAVAGIALLAFPRGGGPGAVAPSASPSVAPSASAALPSGYPISGLLTAGSHATKAFTPPFTFTTPEGWINDGDEASYYSLFQDTPTNRAEFARTGNPAQNIVVASQLLSPYFLCESWEDSRGATAAAMVAKLTANPALATTGVVDVTIGGLTGKQFDVRLNPAWTQSCPGDPPGTDLSTVRGRGIFLDRPGSAVLVIFVPPDLVEAQAIVQSIAFSP